MQAMIAFNNSCVKSPDNFPQLKNRAIIFSRLYNALRGGAPVAPRVPTSEKPMRTKTNAVNAAAENQLGLVLRDLRKERGLTLLEASERTGLPVSTLSKIENSKMSISYDKLLCICKGLEVDIAQLFGADAPAEPVAPRAAFGGRRSITRAGGGYAIETPNYGHLYPAADLLNKQIIPIVAEVRARSLKEFGELIRHTGEEYAFVLEGTVDLHTELYAPTRLETGDSIYFDSGMGHAYIAVGPGPCRVLSICSADPNHEGPHAEPVPAAAPGAAPVTAAAVRKAVPDAPRAAPPAKPRKVKAGAGAR